MDHRLVAWGRAVKTRRRSTVPPLWLFTDAARMPDVVGAVRALPAGLCGVVFRHDGVAGRARLLRAVAAACRERRLALVVAGAGPAPPRAGRHLREGRGKAGATSSAHDRAGLVRARRAGVALVFLSPAFATASHPGAPALGPWRWGAMAHRAGVAVAALGGIDGRSVRRLPACVVAVGAIGALSHRGQHRGLRRGLSPVGHSVSRLPCKTALHDCEVKKDTAILRSGLADPEPVLH